MLFCICNNGFCVFNLLINSVFRLITLCIKTIIFHLTAKRFTPKLDHIKYEVL